MEISRSDFFDMLEFLHNKRKGIKNDNEKNAFVKFLSQPKEEKKPPVGTLISQKIHSIKSQNTPRTINQPNSANNNSVSKSSDKRLSVSERRTLFAQPKIDASPNISPRGEPKKLGREKLSQFNQLKFAKNQ